MRLAEFTVLYLLVGLGCALLVVLRRTGRARFAEAPLVVVFWPLYGPFLMARHARNEHPEIEGDDYLDVLARVEGNALSALLPDRSTVARLSRRLQQAARRMEEIDRLLVTPGFSESEARARMEQLQSRGDERAAAAARGRLQNLERMKGLRDRFGRELDEVRELFAQLRVQAEVLRLSGGSDDGSRELLAEIVARVEGLDAVLADDPEGRA